MGFQNLFDYFLRFLFSLILLVFFRKQIMKHRIKHRIVWFQLKRYPRKTFLYICRSYLSKRTFHCCIIKWYCQISDISFPEFQETCKKVFLRYNEPFSIQNVRQPLSVELDYKNIERIPIKVVHKKYEVYLVLFQNLLHRNEWHTIHPTLCQSSWSSEC